MSEKIEITTGLVQEISLYIEQKKSAKLHDLIADLHIADIAEILEELSVSHAQFLYQIIDEEKSAEILVELDDDLREDLLAGLSPKEIAEEVIDNLESDDAADIIGELSEEKQGEVLSHIEDKEHASDISDLLTYPEDTAGGLMAKELIKVNENWNTLQCLREMRKQAENVKQVHTIYVVDDNDVLLGSMSLRGLLLTETNTPIKEIIKTDIISINANADYYNWDKEVYHKPDFSCAVSAPVNLRNKIKVAPSVTYNGIRISQNSELPPQFHANLDLYYSYSKQLSAYLQLNNLTNSKQDLWRDYREVGFNGIFGLNYSF